MELKYFDIDEALAVAVGSNRTFMELKWWWRQYRRCNLKVLIVPLWN